MNEEEYIVDFQDDLTDGNHLFFSLLDPVLWSIFFEGYKSGEYGEEDLVKFFLGEL